MVRNIHVFFGMAGFRAGDGLMDFITPDELRKTRDYILRANPRNETVVIGHPFLALVTPEHPMEHFDATVIDSSLVREGGMVSLPVAIPFETQHPVDFSQSEEPPPIERFHALADSPWSAFDRMLEELAALAKSNPELYGKMADALVRLMELRRLIRIAGLTTEILPNALSRLVH